MCDLDLTKSSEQLMVEIMCHYDAKFDLCNYAALSIEQYPFTTSSFHEQESPFKGSLREYYWRQFILLDVRRNYGLDINTWLAQEVATITRQIGYLPDVLDERKRIMDALNDGGGPGTK